MNNMFDIDVMHQLVRDTSKVKFDNSSSVELIEPCCPDSKIVIRDIPDNAIILKLDSYKAPDSIFCGSKGECKRSDYVIIADSGSKQKILIIELKRTKGREADIILQMKGAFCFIEYCKTIVKEYWSRKKFLEAFQYRYVSFTHTSIAKRPTRIGRKAKLNDTPEQMMKISYSRSIHFNKLVGA